MADPKFKFYRVRHTNEILPALRYPAGYEDTQPGDFEGVPEDQVPAELLARLGKGPASTVGQAATDGVLAPAANGTSAPVADSVAPAPPAPPAPVIPVAIKKHVDDQKGPSAPPLPPGPPLVSEDA